MAITFKYGVVEVTVSDPSEAAVLIRELNKVGNQVAVTVGKACKCSGYSHCG